MDNRSENTGETFATGILSQNEVEDILGDFVHKFVKKITKIL